MRKIYNLKLKTLGPIFIGNGHTLRKNQYIYDKYKEQVDIIDDAKFIEVLIKAGKYDVFVSEVRQKKVNDLRYFLSQHKIDSKFFKLYSLPVNAFKNTKHRLNDLSLFIRDGNGEAYIPGSSLKGALRTCILSKPDDDKKDNPLFKNLSISDSSVISNDAFKVYQKIDFSSKKKQPNSLPIYRECIKPGTSINFTISFDDVDITLDQIKEGINKTYNCYHDNWASKIKDPQIHPNSKGNRLLIYLGGGAGFVSKTLHYKEKKPEIAKRDILDILKKKYPAYKKLRNPQNVPIAVKITISASRGEPEMGLCELFFEEMEMNL